MRYDLTDDYLADVETRCRRYQGQWCGSIGSYAADAMRLLITVREQKQEIATMQQELLDANQKLRDAVEARLSGGCCDGGKCQPKAIDTRSPLPDVEEVIEEDDARLPPDWILQGQRELEAAPDDIRWKGDGIMAKTPDGLRPDDESSPAERLLEDALAAVRDRRKKYGPPTDHFKITVALVNACFGTSFVPADWATVMQLDKIARSRGPSDCRDNNVDQAGYAACREECQQGQTR